MEILLWRSCSEVGSFSIFSNLDSRIFGHGTLSGDFIPQPKSVEPPIEESEYWKYKSVNINNADNITIVGITIVNAAFHTFNLVMIKSHPLQYGASSKEPGDYFLPHIDVVSPSRPLDPLFIRTGGLSG